MSARTPTGKFATSREALGEFAARISFLNDLGGYGETEKSLGCFVGKMRRPVIPPSFDPLVRGGRTSSYGGLNAQNLPRDDDIRGGFVPSRGHVFIRADYTTIEMATLGPALLAQFGLPSAMAAAINAGQDLHRMVAAEVTGRPESGVTDDERQMAKPVNFGKPGAMGDAAPKPYARSSYGVDLSGGEVAALSGAWPALVPDMAAFSEAESDPGEDVAGRFAQTPASRHDHTGDRKFVDPPANAGRAGAGRAAPPEPPPGRPVGLPGGGRGVRRTRRPGSEVVAAAGPSAGLTSPHTPGPGGVTARCPAWGVDPHNRWAGRRPENPGVVKAAAGGSGRVEGAAAS